MARKIRKQTIRAGLGEQPGRKLVRRERRLPVSVSEQRWPWAWVGERSGPSSAQHRAAAGVEILEGRGIEAGRGQKGMAGEHSLTRRQEEPQNRGIIRETGGKLWQGG